jgi:hypothetical protein
MGPVDLGEITFRSAVPESRTFFDGREPACRREGKFWRVMAFTSEEDLSWSRP